MMKQQIQTFNNNCSANSSPKQTTKPININNSDKSDKSPSLKHHNEVIEASLTAKHWSKLIHESTISNQLIDDDQTSFLDQIKGGSDHGKFVHFDSDFVESDYTPMVISGNLNPSEIILEIQSYKISGYTHEDVIILLKQLAKTYQTITLKTVKSTVAHDVDVYSTESNHFSYSLPIELRTYLDERFQKGSIDYDLQQTIRENVYMRTVPCTTRPARPGEIHGQDYIFLTNEQFLQLEQSGDLLEYGVYNGHYYGTPKPPKQKLNATNSAEYSTGSDINSSLNTLQNNTKKHENDTKQSEINNVIKENCTLSSVANRENEINEDINHKVLNYNNICTTLTQQTQQNDLTNQKQSNVENNELIPYGWEKVEDPEYGTFYIDHINKQTTYENPLAMHQSIQINSLLNNLNPKSSKAKNLQSENIDLNSNLLRRNVFFTRNPQELKGEFIKTTLQKTPYGFGFTIIGANETSEDFLQIKFIVPEGAAARDGHLKQGDVLVYVNNECVLGYTHQDVVEIFQSIPAGNNVELTVCRGYPLSIDPNDPNIEIMSLPAINNPNNQYVQPAPLASVDELSLSQKQVEPDEYFCEEYDVMYVSIVKGPKGFGFTIADDSQMNHQKVKQILDKERCCNLVENDILLEINGQELRNLTHNQVVEVLKECVKGEETIIRLKRRKYQIVMSQTPNDLGLLVGNNFDNLNQQGSDELNNQNINNNIPKSNGCISHGQYTMNDSSSLIANGSELQALANRNSGSTLNPKNDNQITLQQQQHNQIEQQKQYTNAYNNNARFNYERRSKTPNILHSGTNQSNIPDYQINLKSNLNSNNISSYQPPLRSKTPTTDRMLFSSKSNFNSDYIYLTNTDVQLNNQKTNELYSTISKPIKAMKGNVETDRLDNAVLINGPFKHMTIQDSTSNIQHQRINNAAKLNALNRSKTPGPDVIYFRNNNSSQLNATEYQQLCKLQSSNGKAATISAGSNYFASRSKTPTADIMYYPTKPTNGVNGSQSENIYQTFSTESSNDHLIDLLSKNKVSLSSDVDGNNFMEMVIDLHKQDSGFGFRIVGGEEEGSQVSVGFIVQGGAAHLDNRLRPGDEIIMIDEECVLGVTHRRVVQLMTIAGLKRQVKLMIRRKLTMQQYKILMNFKQQQQQSHQPHHGKYPYTITLFRNGNEGFGFVIISTIHKSGPSIGKIVENSPAERCKRLNVGDRIVAVNGINIIQMNHLEIVKLIKESGSSITLTIGAPLSQQEKEESSVPLHTNFSRLSFHQPPATTPIPQITQSPAASSSSFINQNEYHVIELRKTHSCGFGFSIRGGKEFNIPLFVLKLADNGPAAVDGRLQVGDLILEINGFDAYNMTHNEAIERIKASSHMVTLLIRRTGLPPPSITDIISANATAAVLSAQQQQQQQIQQFPTSLSSQNLNSNEMNLNSSSRSKLAYLSNQQQQYQNNGQVKQFSSSGTLTNRNF